MGLEREQSSLEIRARKLLATQTELRGELYWRSDLKRKLDRRIAYPASRLLLPVILLAGAAILIDDRQWPPWVILKSAP